MRLKKSMTAAMQGQEKLMETAAVAEPAMSSQTEVYAFTGSFESVTDAIAYDKQSQKRVRQPTGEQPAPARLGSC